MGLQAQIQFSGHFKPLILFVLRMMICSALGFCHHLLNVQLCHFDGGEELAAAPTGRSWTRSAQQQSRFTCRSARAPVATCLGKRGDAFEEMMKWDDMLVSICVRKPSVRKGWRWSSKWNQSL